MTPILRAKADKLCPNLMCLPPSVPHTLLLSLFIASDCYTFRSNLDIILKALTPHVFFSLLNFIFHTVKKHIFVYFLLRLVSIPNISHQQKTLNYCHLPKSQRQKAEIILVPLLCSCIFPSFMYCDTKQHGCVFIICVYWWR